MPRPPLFGTIKSNRRLRSSTVIIPGRPTQHLLDPRPPSSYNFLEEQQDIIIQPQPSEYPKILAKRKRRKEQRKNRRQRLATSFNDNQRIQYYSKRASKVHQLAYQYKEKLQQAMKELNLVECERLKGRIRNCFSDYNYFKTQCYRTN